MKKHLTKPEFIIFLIFIIWRSILMIVSNLSAFFIPIQANFLGKGFDSWQHPPLLWTWANFDGEHYLSIATYGYKQFEYAFFPGFPGLIKLINVLINNPLLTGFLISNILAFVLLMLLYKLFSLDLNKDSVYLGILLLLCFPSAFFIGSVYSESLFLCLAVGSFLAARKNYFFLASVLAIFAGFTRLVGVFLIPALLIIWFKQSKRLLDLLPVLFTPLGIIMVFFFNYIYTADPLNFFHAQSSFGANRSGSSIILLPQVIFRYLKIFITSRLSISLFVAVQEFLATILVLGLIIKFWKKLRSEYLIFSLGVVLTPTLTGTFSSMPRYVLAAFPIFFILARLNKKILWSIIAIFLTLQIIDLSLFTNGYFVS